MAEIHTIVDKQAAHYRSSLAYGYAQVSRTESQADQAEMRPDTGRIGHKIRLQPAVFERPRERSAEPYRCNPLRTWASAGSDANRFSATHSQQIAVKRTPMEDAQENQTSCEERISSFVAEAETRVFQPDPLISPADIRELARRAEHVITTIYSQHKPLRPSAAARKLHALANSLTRAASAMSELGPSGFELILVSIPGSTEPHPNTFSENLDYLERLAKGATHAAEFKSDEAKGLGDNLGGRPADTRLTAVVILLMDAYRGQLKVIPTHTVDPDTGIGSSQFDKFLQLCLLRFLPIGLRIEDRKLDEIVKKTLDTRDDDYFSPPRL
jgi:hypothetical protein